MSGTKAGSIKAQETMKKKYGKDGYHDFFRMIGSIGGQNGHSGGFASTVTGKDGLTGRERARIAGSKGGKISTRLGVKNGQGRKKWEDDIDQAEKILEEEDI